MLDTVRVEDDTLALAQQLFALPSITPNDAGCQKLLSERLEKMGFICEQLRFGEVDNLWAKIGNQSPLMIFAGHTDVVPTGPLSDWISPPFQPQIREGNIYARGACDMKGSLAAMVIATEQFIAEHPRFAGSIAFLITSDEEGEAINGTKKVIEVLKQRNVSIDYCIVGEPSSIQEVGDQIRVGRRGSLHGELIIHGKQGHVAHPHLAINPIHNSLLALHELSNNIWDQGNEDFPPTTFQLTNIHGGTGAANVIPGHLEVLFNFRFSTAVTVDELKNITETLLKKHQLNFQLKWKIGALPFLSKKGRLITETQRAIKKITDLDVKLSTGGGTSDARFIAPTGAEILELGLSHATAHHVNEHVNVKDLKILTQLYYHILLNLFEARK